MTRILPLLLLAAVALTAVAASPGMDADFWRERYIVHLQAWRVEKAARVEAEALAESHEIEAARLTGLLESQNALIEPLRADNDRLRERNAELAVLGSVETARQQITGLQATRDALAVEVNALSAEKSSLAASLNVLQSAQAWIASECPTGYECRGFPVGCSGSMRPTFDCDDLPVGHAYPASVSQGDIVIYEGWSTNCGVGFYIIHRIVGGGPDGYITKGDAHSAPDGCIVPFSAIVAVIDRVFHGAFPENLSD